jgi:hypothetical protein
LPKNFEHFFPIAVSDFFPIETPLVLPYSTAQSPHQMPSNLGFSAMPNSIKQQADKSKTSGRSTKHSYPPHAYDIRLHHVM